MLLVFTLSAYASRYDSLAIAEQLVEKVNLDNLAIEVIIQSVSSVTTSQDEKKSVIEFMSVVKEVYVDDIKKEVANALVENYSDEELRTITKHFENSSINRCFNAYYKMFLSGENRGKEEKQRFSKNINLLKDYANGKTRRPPKYLNHNHFGKKYKDDNVLKMLMLMDGLKGNSVVAYDKWAQNRKKEEISIMIDLHPELKRHSKELDKLYDTTFDTFVHYWLLKENKNLTENDFFVTASALENNESFRRFFIEIYSVPKTMHESMMKKYRLMKKLEKPSLDKNHVSVDNIITYQV